MNSTLKKTSAGFVALLVVILYSSFRIPEQNNITTPVKSIKMNPFSVLSVDGPFTVELIQATEASIDITSSDALRKDIELDNNEGHLYVKWKQEQSNLAENIPVKIYVTSLSDLSLNTNGEVSCKEQLSFDKINVGIKSKGQSSLSIDAKQIVLTDQAAGNVKLSGNATALTIYHYGTGSIDASRFKATNAALMNNGKGNVDVFASGQLGITSTGPGTVKYYGQPTQVKISNSSNATIEPARQD